MVVIIDAIDGGGRPCAAKLEIDAERNTSGASSSGPQRGSHVKITMSDEEGQYAGAYSFDAGELLHAIRSVSGPK